MFNLLDYPGMVFPTGLKADPAIDAAVKAAPLSPADEYNQSICEYTCSCKGCLAANP